jgi:hypothetical protein
MLVCLGATDPFELSGGNVLLRASAEAWSRIADELESLIDKFMNGDADQVLISKLEQCRGATQAVAAIRQEPAVQEHAERMRARAIAVLTTWGTHNRSAPWPLEGLAGPEVSAAKRLLLAEHRFETADPDPSLHFCFLIRFSLDGLSVFRVKVLS